MPFSIEKLFISEAFQVHNVKVPQECLVPNRFSGRGMASVKVGNEILDLLKDKVYKPFVFN